MKLLITFLLVSCFFVKPVLTQCQLVHNNYTKNSVIAKPCIDDATINSWPFFGDFPRISNDGKYFKYNYSKGAETRNILVVSSTDTSWKMEFPDADYISGYFSSDSKTFYFKKLDTLFFIELLSKKITKIENVKSLKQPERYDGEWLAYQLKNDSNTLIAYNLISHNHAQFENVQDYYFNSNGSALVLKTAFTHDGMTTTTLKWISLPPCKVVVVYQCSYPANSHSKSISSLTFSPNGYQIAFIVRNNDSTRRPEYMNRTTIERSPTNNELWYYASDMNEAVLKVNDQSDGIPADHHLHSTFPMFSKDGKFIYFQFYKPFIQNEQSLGVMVDVWSYRDTVLQCTQLEQPYFSRYTASISATGKKVIQLTHDFESINVYAEKAPLVVVNYNTRDDRFWKNAPDTNWLVSFEDGRRTRLPMGYKQYSFSPDGKYLIFFDLSDYNYYAYNLATKIISNISASVPSGLMAYKLPFYKNYPDNFLYPPVGIGAWETNDSSLLVYDLYDIWRLDPSGKNPAVNITKGVGRATETIFRITYGMASSNYPVIVENDESIMLTAFNTKTKENGFYTIKLNDKSVPKLLVSGPNVFDLTSHHMLPYNAQNFNTGYGMAPVKAKEVTAWIIKRQSFSEAPNYFITKNFKTFRALTNYQPHKAVNWLSAELIKWEQLDGTESQGVLYKPENLDASKKYPVIFNYYQQRSHRFNQFPSPEYTIANIDVAWFVSRGYIVFTPDIYFKYGQSGWSAYNTLVSAANHLSTLSYVDSLKMGINGHSVGGGLTNFLITHTNKFAAAIECAGVSNTISSALQLGGTNNESSRMGGAEFFMGDVSIWQAPQKYLEVSPIMHADKVVTPLLIMHNKVDGGVPWAQAVELYLALRRLEKPVWMLQYDKGDHSLWGTKAEAIDFSIRITQFFDHYLKGLPAPRWMTNGIPAKMKGIDPGYELVEDSKK